MTNAHFRVSFLFLALFTFLATLISSQAHAFSRAKNAQKAERTDEAPIERGNYSPMEQRSWYVAVNGAMGFVSDASLHSTGGIGFDGKVAFDTGYGFSGAIGHSFGIHNNTFSNVRVEIEEGYYSNDMNKFTSSSNGTTDLSDSLTMQTTMLNVYADLDSNIAWKPYFGAGVGAGRIKAVSSSLNLDNTEAVVAYQGMAGVTYQPVSMHNTAFSAGYRYLTSSDPKFTSKNSSEETLSYASHILEMGMRLRF